MVSVMGATTNYGGNTPATLVGATNLSSVPLAGVIASLSGGTFYHFRAVASNTVATTYGPDVSFLTLTFGHHGVSRHSARLRDRRLGRF